jgi:hypothetical protein
MLGRFALLSLRLSRFGLFRFLIFPGAEFHGARPLRGARSSREKMEVLPSDR